MFSHGYMKIVIFLIDGFLFPASHNNVFFLLLRFQ